MALLDQTGVRTALRAAIAAAGTSATALARDIGRDQNYVRDFLNGKKGSLGASDTAKIEAALGLTSGALIADEPAPAASPPRTPIIPGRQLVGRRDLPIYAAAQGGADGHTIVTFDAVDWMKRPAPLENVRGGYGIIVMNDSMYPAFDQGDTALVNPHLPPVFGADVVLYSSSELSGEVDCMIKRYISRSSTDWKLRQFNPAMDFDEKVADWPVCHRVVGKYSVR